MQGVSRCRMATEARVARRAVWQTARLLHAPASVAKLVDARDSKSRSARSVGSIPTRGTTACAPTFSMSDSAPTYPTIEDVIGATPLVRLVRLPGRRQRSARQRHPRQARGQQPGRLGQGPAGDQHDPARRGARRDQARRHADRGDLGQHRHRAGDGGGDPRLPHAADHARGPERRARADDEGVRRRADPDAALGRHGVRARPGDADAEATARAASSTSSPTPTTRASTTRRPGPRSGATPAGAITHFVSAMGTTGTITGVSRFLKEKNPAVRIIGAQPNEGSRIPGHPQVAGGVPAEDLRPDGGRRDRPTSARPTPRR